jgi:hypothetical protein
MEAGNKNNNEANDVFNDIRNKFRLQEVLRSLSFVSKESSRAIQMADLLAFYSRRSANSLYLARKDGKDAYRIDTMDRIIVDASGLPYRGFVATDFEHDPTQAGQEPLPSWRPPS